MRHAEAAQSGSSDAERPLTDSGAVAAREAGAWLSTRHLVPDLALVSAARRAVHTWESVCAGLGCDESVGDQERALYTAGPDAVLDLIQLVEDDIGTLFVVGHNPTMSVLAMMLDDGATSILLENAGFPPGALAIFEVQSTWSQLQLQGASAVDFHVARG